MEGLGGKAAGKGETMTAIKLMGCVEEKLPEIKKKYTQEAQYPALDSRGMDFPLVIAKETTDGGSMRKIIFFLIRSKT